LATIPVIPLDNPDFAALKIDVLALKTSHERLEWDLGIVKDKLEKLTDKLDKLADKVAELSGDLREVKTKVGIVTGLLGAVGVLLVTSACGFPFSARSASASGAGVHDYSTCSRRSAIQCSLGRGYSEAEEIAGFAAFPKAKIKSYV
jgi:hypothetical protein